MENKILLAAAIAFTLVGFMIGFPVGKGCNKCPEIIAGVKDTSTTIIDTADTVKIVKDSSEIKVEKRVVKRVKKKPIIIAEKPDTVPVVEEVETICHSWDETQDDGAYIECTLCSDSLPSSVVNSQAEIDYKAPPEIVKTITRIDTVREEVSKPLHKDWKTYAFGTVIAILAGLLASK